MSYSCDSPCVTKACRPSSQTTFCCQRGGRKAVLHTPCHQRCSPKLPCICLRHHQKNRNYSIWNPIRFVENFGKRSASLSTSRLQVADCHRGRLTRRRWPQQRYRQGWWTCWPRNARGQGSQRRRWENQMATAFPMVSWRWDTRAH